MTLESEGSLDLDGNFKKLQHYKKASEVKRLDT